MVSKKVGKSTKSKAATAIDSTFDAIISASVNNITPQKVKRNNTLKTTTKHKKKG